MWKNRIAYGVLLLCVAVLSFVSGRLYLVGLTVLLLLLPVAVALALYQDKTCITGRMELTGTCREGQPVELVVNVEGKRRILAAYCVELTLEFQNHMMGSKREEVISLELSNRKSRFELPLTPEKCGETVIVCKKAMAVGLLGLCQMSIEAPASVFCTVYPRQVELEVDVSGDSRVLNQEGMGDLNQKGTDASEMFDIREYRAGDDIRRVHWKLSSKSDELILRESSEPAHCNMILIPSFERESCNSRTGLLEINTAVAVGVKLAEKLVEEQVAFALAVPAERGLQVREIRSRKELRQGIAMWLGCPILGEAGIGLKYFSLEHMEQQYTRLIALTCGENKKELESIGGNVSVTVINVMENGQMTQTKINQSSAVIELPCRQEEAYRILL